MTREYRNQVMRRSWSPQRRLEDAERRERQRAHLVRMVRRPLSPDQTHGMAREEAEIVNHLRGRRDPWVGQWAMLNELSKGGPERDRRPRRQALLALLGRMLRERKLVRHRRSNSVCLAVWLRVPVGQAVEEERR